MRSLNSITPLILLAVVVCCSAFIEVQSSSRQGVNQTNVISITDAVTSFVRDQGRRLGWLINWLASTGVLGQMLANVMVAIFYLPPLGPYICGFFDNCENLEIRTHNLLRALNMGSAPPAPLARKAKNVEEMNEEMARILTWLDDAYNKYST